MQIVLIDMGFDIGEPDGRLGSRTRQALISFQRQQGLQTSGQIDQRTMTALRASGKFGQQGGQGQGTGQQPSTTGQGETQQSPAQQGTQSGQQPSTGGQQGSDRMQQSPERGAGTGQQGSGQQPSTTGQGGAPQQSPGRQDTGPGQGTNPPARPPTAESGQRHARAERTAAIVAADKQLSCKHLSPASAGLFFVAAFFVRRLVEARIKERAMGGTRTVPFDSPKLGDAVSVVSSQSIADSIEVQIPLSAERARLRERPGSRFASCATVHAVDELRYLETKSCGSC